MAISLERHPDDMTPVERMFKHQGVQIFVDQLAEVVQSKKEIDALIEEELEGMFGDFS